jgi:hypothetical protein
MPAFREIVAGRTENGGSAHGADLPMVLRAKLD